MNKRVLDQKRNRAQRTSLHTHLSRVARQVRVFVEGTTDQALVVPKTQIVPTTAWVEQQERQRLAAAASVVQEPEPAKRGPLAGFIKPKNQLATT